MPDWKDFLDQLLGGEPRLSYYGQLGQQNATPLMRKYFQSNYDSVYNDYLGELGRQVMGGAVPTLQFNDYLKQQPFAQRYAQVPAEFSGRMASWRDFNPLTQWRF